MGDQPFPASGLDRRDVGEGFDLGQGFVALRPGPDDRRVRLLFATEKGRRLAGELTAAQAASIDRALGGAGPAASVAAARFLTGLVSAADRELIAAREQRADSARPRRD